MTTPVHPLLAFASSKRRCSTSKHYTFERVLPISVGGQPVV